MTDMSERVNGATVVVLQTLTAHAIVGEEVMLVLCKALAIQIVRHADDEADIEKGVEVIADVIRKQAQHYFETAL